VDFRHQTVPYVYNLGLPKERVLSFSEEKQNWLEVKDIVMDQTRG
jgi:hypothetical protein